MLLRNLIDQLVKHPHARRRSRQIEVQPRQPAGRIGHHQQGRDKGEKFTRRRPVIDHAPAAIGHHQSHRNPAQRIDQRIGAGLRPHHAVGQIFHIGNSRAHMTAQGLLQPEGAYDADAVGSFLHDRHQTRHRIHLAAEQFAHLFEQFRHRQK